MRVWPGRSYPLGATLDADGVNFSVSSGLAQRIELCLFDADGIERRVDLPEVTAMCWHGFVPGIRAGQRYGFRVHGPYEPQNGCRCNPAKLLVDPYAKAVSGSITWEPDVFPYVARAGDADAELTPSDRDNAHLVPRSVVIDGSFDWGDDRPPATPWSETVVYELHVKGFTRLMPIAGDGREVRGTYAGLASPEAVAHLQRLGVTAVELMPVHQFLHDDFLVKRGLRNYWGYNSYAFFAPHNEYSASGDTGGQVVEFKQMVRALHAAGIEVILDVVYNHTGEGAGLGPAITLKGFDNFAYYRVDEADKRRYVDYTGTGNSLNMRNPFVLQLIMDSLRYWVTEMHVDGFRFDLAATLARELHDVDRLSAFFDLVHQDPVLRTVKLIAEPWDVGEGGYQVGNFPPLWSEWNGKFRDAVRDFWRGGERSLGEIGYRLTGSSDLYASSGRSPHASINFVTAHDGFTLADLVSYNDKHNESNGENNRDGSDDNRSWNCGVEGPTDDPTITALRAKQQRNLLTTLLVSQGVPMLVAGDELGRTQRGNNNAYCHDDEISWVDWAQADARSELVDFVAALVRLRRDHPAFRRPRFFQGRPIHGTGCKDVGWFSPAGVEMTDEEWAEASVQSLAVYLNGDAIDSVDRHGEPIRDDTFLIVANGAAEPVEFVLPPPQWAAEWVTAFDTASGQHERRGAGLAADSPLLVADRSVQVLVRTS